MTTKTTTNDPYAHTLGTTKYGARYAHYWSVMGQTWEEAHASEEIPDAEYAAMSREESKAIQDWLDGVAADGSFRSITD